MNFINVSEKILSKIEIIDLRGCRFRRKVEKVLGKWKSWRWRYGNKGKEEKKREDCDIEKGYWSNIMVIEIKD